MFASHLADRSNYEITKMYLKG